MFAVAQVDSLISLPGLAGLLATVFILFYIDAIVFPTLPELVAVLIFLANPTVIFAIAILGTIVLAEFLGFNTLYFIVKRIRVPKAIDKAAKKYCHFLLVSDEKVILVNRIAPVVPFVGAFAALQEWSWPKCIVYNLIGGVLKYGAILALSSFFAVYLSSGLSQLVTIVLIIAVIAISFVFSFFRRKRMKKETCDATGGQKPG